LTCFSPFSLPQVHPFFPFFIATPLFSSVASARGLFSFQKLAAFLAAPFWDALVQLEHSRVESCPPSILCSGWEIDLPFFVHPSCPTPEVHPPPFFRMLPSCQPNLFFFPLPPRHDGIVALPPRTPAQPWFLPTVPPCCQGQNRCFLFFITDSSSHFFGGFIALFFQKVVFWFLTLYGGVLFPVFPFRMLFAPSRMSASPWLSPLLCGWGMSNEQVPHSSKMVASCSLLFFVLL